MARSLVPLLVLIGLSACSAPETREDQLVVGRRNAKLYAESTLAMRTNDPYFRMESDIDNLGWKRYWSETQVFNDPDIVKWNDRVHALYAVYAFEPGDETANREGRGVWLFVDRGTGEVQGHLLQQRGYKTQFGEAR